MRDQKSKIKNQRLIINSFKLSFTLCTLLFALLPFNAKTALAQSFSLGVYPALLEVTIMPGKSITQAYQLTNDGENTTINIAIQPFGPNDEFGNVLLGAETSNKKYNWSDWFNLENADVKLGEPFFLAAKETKQIVLKVNVPKDVEEDDYYFTLLFSTQPNMATSLSGTRQAGVIGSNLLITASKTGEPIKNGEIVEFTVKNLKFKILDSFERPELLLRVKNTSRSYWKPVGKITGESVLGYKWEQELLPENVLAHSIRQIDLATPSATPRFLLGPYQVKAEFGLDNNETQLASTVSFIALPIKFFAGLAAAIILLLLIRTKIGQFRGKTKLK